MEKIEEKHICSYLPYKPKVLDTKGGRQHTLIPFKRNYERIDDKMPLKEFMGYEHKNYKILLHPLEMITKEIEHNGEKFVPIERLYNTGLNVIKFFEDRRYYLMAIGDNPNAPVIYEVEKDLKNEKYWKLQKLFEWNIDVFNLIPKGLAIDKSKYNK